MDVSKRGWKIINHLASCSSYNLSICCATWSWLMNIGLRKSKIENPKKRTNISKTIVWNFVFRNKYLLLEPCFSINLTSTSSSTTSISCYFQNLKYTINRVYKSWIETRSVTLACWQYHCAIQWCIDKLITNGLHRSIKLKWSPVSEI